MDLVDRVVAVVVSSVAVADLVVADAARVAIATRTRVISWSR